MTVPRLDFIALQNRFYRSILVHMYQEFRNTISLGVCLPGCVLPKDPGNSFSGGGPGGSICPSALYAISTPEFKDLRNCLLSERKKTNCDELFYKYMEANLIKTLVGTLPF